MRKLVFAAAFAILAWAAFVVRLPLLVLEPHPAQQVREVIQLGETGDEISGQILFTAVQLHPTTTAGAIDAATDRFRDLTFLPALAGGEQGEDFVEAQQRVFRESVQVSAAVGLRAAGRDVEVSGDGVRVMAVLPDSPAQDSLQPGDIIVEVDGRPVELATQLVAVLSRHSPGDEVELMVERGRERQQVTVTLHRLEQTGNVGIGIAVTTVRLSIDLPVEVTASEDAQVGGPSAGLMMALTIYDLVEPGDLTNGRVVAGTGTLDLEGRVGMVSGVAEKVRGAELAGATVFLVPAQLAEEARDAAPEGMEIIPVESFDEALSALER